MRPAKCAEPQRNSDEVHVQKFRLSTSMVQIWGPTDFLRRQLFVTISVRFSFILTWNCFLQTMCLHVCLCADPVPDFFCVIMTLSNVMP